MYKSKPDCKPECEHKYIVQACQCKSGEELIFHAYSMYLDKNSNLIFVNEERNIISAVAAGMWHSVEIEE